MGAMWLCGLRIWLCTEVDRYAANYSVASLRRRHAIETSGAGANSQNIVCAAGVGGGEG